MIDNDFVKFFCIQERGRSSLLWIWKVQDYDIEFIIGCFQEFPGIFESEVGTRIFHQKFGYGTIVASEAGKLEIDFEKAGTKKVMKSFVQRA